MCLCMVDTAEHCQLSTLFKSLSVEWCDVCLVDTPGHKSNDRLIELYPCLLCSGVSVLVNAAGHYHMSTWSLSLSLTFSVVFWCDCVHGICCRTLSNVYLKPLSLTFSVVFWCDCVHGICCRTLSNVYLKPLSLTFSVVFWCDCVHGICCKALSNVHLIDVSLLPVFWWACVWQIAQDTIRMSVFLKASPPPPLSAVFWCTLCTASTAGYYPMFTYWCLSPCCILMRTVSVYGLCCRTLLDVHLIEVSLPVVFWCGLCLSVHGIYCRTLLDVHLIEVSLPVGDCVCVWHILQDTIGCPSYWGLSSCWGLCLCMAYTAGHYWMSILLRSLFLLGIVSVCGIYCRGHYQMSTTLRSLPLLCSDVDCRGHCQMFTILRSLPLLCSYVDFREHYQISTILRCSPCCVLM